MTAAAQQSPAAARAKPRPPKKPKTPDTSDLALDPHDTTGDDAKLKPKRRAPKKKETDLDTAAAVDSRAQSTTHALFMQQRSLDDQRYERAPRLLPDIAGVQALSLTEATADLRRIQTALSAFDSAIALSGNLRDELAPDRSALKLPSRHAPSVVRTPEELVESLPVCRRAVRLTQRELNALKRERDDLERDFMRLRAQYVHHVRALTLQQKQHARVARVLSRDVVTIAKSLESSRRRTNALQDIMTELEVRGTTVVRLTREKRGLEALLVQHDVPLPTIDAVYVGDRVTCSSGVGRVVALDPATRTLTLTLEVERLDDKTTSGEERNDTVVTVHEDDADVLPVETTYVDAERELKQRFFDKIGALVGPDGIVGLTTAVGRRHERGGTSATVSDDDDDGSDDDNDSDNDDNDSDNDDADASDVPKSDADAEHVVKPKKRKLTMMPLPSALKKRQKAAAARVMEFPASTIPSTPFDAGLLLSPLSTLPDRVAAVASPGAALQWNDAHLPSRMREWEQERYDALQMKGEVERLRFQLQKAEAEKLDAQQHASDQLESINQLVMQLDKLRESVSASNSNTTSAGSSTTSSQCPHCSAGNNGSRKSSTAAAKATSKANAAKGSGGGKKDEASKRSHRESIDGFPGSEEAEKPEKKPRSDNPDDDDDDDDSGETDGSGAKRSAPSRELLAAGGDDDDDADAAGESSDGASSKPAPRSLRPRRKPTSNATTASPKQAK